MPYGPLGPALLCPLCTLHRPKLCYVPSDNLLLITIACPFSSRPVNYLGRVRSGEALSMCSSAKARCCVCALCPSPGQDVTSVVEAGQPGPPVTCCALCVPSSLPSPIVGVRFGLLHFVLPDAWSTAGLLPFCTHLLRSWVKGHLADSLCSMMCTAWPRNTRLRAGCLPAFRPRTATTLATYLF